MTTNHEVKCKKCDGPIDLLEAIREYPEISNGNMGEPLWFCGEACCKQWAKEANENDRS